MYIIKWLEFKHGEYEWQYLSSFRTNGWYLIISKTGWKSSAIELPQSVAEWLSDELKKRYSLDAKIQQVRD